MMITLLRPDKTTVLVNIAHIVQVEEDSFYAPPNFEQQIRVYFTNGTFHRFLGDLRYIQSVIVQREEEG